MKSKLLSKLPSALSSDKARLVFVIAGLSAVLLIFLSSQFGDEKSSETSISDLSSSAYCNTLSAELVDMIEDISGAGETRVLLTLESSYEYVYLDDDRTLSKILEPSVRGVAVACKGGDDPLVREKVTQMLTTVLSVDTSCISVSKLL